MKGQVILDSPVESTINGWKSESMPIHVTRLFLLNGDEFWCNFFVYGKVSVFLYIQLTKNDLNNQQIFEIVLRMAKMSGR